MTFASIALSQGMLVTNTRPKCCVYKRRRKISEEYDSDYWKHMATVSVALVYSKLLDNYFDDPTVFAKLGLGVFTKWSRKAQKNDPELFERLRRSVYKIVDAEHSGEGFAVQSRLTAEMLSEAFCDRAVDCDDNTRAFLSSASEWLCLVDALDDYERDRRRKKYNPLIMLWKDAGEDDLYRHDVKSLFDSKYMVVAKTYSDIVFGMKTSLAKMRVSGNEREFLGEMVNRVMPERLSRLIKNIDGLNF